MKIKHMVVLYEEKEMGEHTLKGFRFRFYDKNGTKHELVQMASPDDELLGWASAFRGASDKLASFALEN